MSQDHPTDADDAHAGEGPRHDSDDRTESDAGLTGDEGVQDAQPGIAHNDGDER